VVSNRPDDQQASAAALHLLQSCLVYVNTLMLQRVFAEDRWRERMTAVWNSVEAWVWRTSRADCDESRVTPGA